MSLYPEEARQDPLADKDYDPAAKCRRCGQIVTIVKESMSEHVVTIYQTAASSLSSWYPSTTHACGQPIPQGWATEIPRWK